MSANMSSWANAESEDDEPSQPPAPSPSVTAAADSAPPAAPERLHRERRDRERSNFTVSVGNLNYSTTEQELGDFFNIGGCAVTRVSIVLQDGKSRGFGYVEFADRESAELALKAQGEQLNGRSLKVEPKRNERRDNRDRKERDGRGRGRESRHGGDEIDWTKKESLPELDHKDHGRDRERDANRRPRDGGAGRGRRDPPAPDAPVTRPKLNILPRSIPIEPAAASPTVNSNIFGEGKPRIASATETLSPVANPADKVDSVAASVQAVSLSDAPETAKSKELEKKDRSDKPRAERGERAEKPRYQEKGSKDGNREKGPQRRERQPPKDKEAPKAGTDEFKEVKDAHRKEKHSGKDKDNKKSVAATSETKPALEAASSASTVSKKQNPNRFSYLVMDDEEDA